MSIHSHVLETIKFSLLVIMNLTHPYFVLNVCKDIQKGLLNERLDVFKPMM